MKKILLMEGKKIKNIITAIGNPILNNELKKIENINILNNDILYQEGIFEILDSKKEINFLILSQILPGNYSLEELIEKIKEKNKKIKIIIILENMNNELENILTKKGIYRILYNNSIEINDVLKIINEDEKMEKYNEEIRKEIEELKKYIINNKNINLKNNKLIKEKNNKKIIKFNENINEIKINKKTKNIKKYSLIKIIKNIILKNKLFKKLFIKLNNNNIIQKIIKNNSKNLNQNKIISVLGNSGAGKSVFSVILANYLKKDFNKILIIDFDILNNSLHTILGVNKYSDKIRKIIKENNNQVIKNNENIKINIDSLIIKINKKIDLISGINLIINKNNKNNSETIKFILQELSKKYEKIIIDTSSECFFDYTKEIIKISNNNIFLTEANLLELSKSKRILDIYYNNWNIEKNKIKIIFNKFNKKSINLNLLKKLYMDYEVIGKIDLNNNYNSLINYNFRNLFLYSKKTFKIGEKIKNI